MAAPPIFAHKNRKFDHIPGLNAIDFDSKSERVAGAGLKNQVCIFYMNQKKRTLFLNGHHGAIFDVNFNRNGALLASGGKDRTMLVYESPSELCNSRSTAFNCHFGEVHSVEFSNDSEYILTGSSDKMVRIVSLKKEKQVAYYLKHNNWVRCARYAKSNKYFVSGSDDGMIHLWDLRAQDTVNSVSMKGQVVKVATDSSDRHFAGVTPKGISIYDVRICKRLQHYAPEEHHDYTSAHFHPSKPWILMGQVNGSVCITDLISGETSYQKSDLLSELFDVKFSPCDKYFAVSGKSCQAQMQVYLLDCEANVASSSTLKSYNALSSSKSMSKPHLGSKSTSSLETENLNSNSKILKPLPSSKSTPSLEIKNLNDNSHKVSALSIDVPLGSESNTENYSLFGSEKPDAWHPFIGLKYDTAICQPLSSDLENKQYGSITRIPCDSHQSRPDILTERGISQLYGLESRQFTEEEAEKNTAIFIQNDDILLDELDEVWLKCSYNFQKLRNHERNIAAMSTSLIDKHTKSTYFDKNSSNVSLRNFKNWLVRLSDVLSDHDKEMTKHEAELRHEYNKMEP